MEKVKEFKRVILPVRGMTCASCAKTVRTVLTRMEGVEGVEVDFANGRAVIDLSDTLNLSEAAKRVREMGYVLVYDEVRIHLVGGSESDAEALAEKLKELPGVVAAYPVGESVLVQFSPVQTSREAVISAARKSGFEIEVEGAKESRRRGLTLFQRFLFSLPATIGVALGHHFGVPPFTNPVLQGVLSAFVVLFCGWPIVRSGVGALRVLSPNMNTLIGLGSVIALFSGHFSPAAMIITLILMGKSIEERARKRAYEELGGLIDSLPSLCRVERNGEVVEVPCEEVMEGEEVVVTAGEKVPVDGTVVEGEGEVSLSLLTGESVPAPVKTGDRVLAGSILTDGFLKVRVERSGEDTFIGGIRRMVLEAQSRKGEIQRVADRISGYFVYAVGSVAALTVVGWLLAGYPLSSALMAAVSVMVVACPCALGIATPLVFAVATAVAGKRGILIKGADVIERGRGIRTVVFDKTGTLTVGLPEVVKYEGPEDLLPYAYSLARRSQHPYSRAIVRFVKAKKMRVQDFKVIAGKGLEGVVDGRRVRLGRADFAGTEGEGVFVSVEGLGTGRFVVEDPVRPEAKDVVRELKEMGKRVIVLSGDSEENVRKVARVLEADGYAAGVLPEEKVEYVRRLRENGRVMFVGDGINDAPVLAVADVGVAMGSASDIAALSGDAVLIRSDLTGVPFFVRLIDASYIKVLQNLGWAFLYNTLLVPLAALGKVSPEWAAFAMSASSISVVLNSLALRLRFRSR